MPEADTDVLAYGEEATAAAADAVLEDRATGYGVMVAQAGGRPRARPQGRGGPAPRTADILLLFDAGDDQIPAVARTYAREVLRVGERDLREKVRGVNSWDEFAAALRRYGRVDRLVLMFHGVPGSIGVGNTFRSLERPADLLGEGMPAVGRIEFEGCNIGEGADELVPFGRYLRASRVSAWNHSWVTMTVDLTIPKGADPAEVRQGLRRFDGYFLPQSLSSDSLSRRRAGHHRVIVEWFREDLSDAPLPEPPPPGELDDRRHTFKPRSSGRERRVDATGAAALAQEYSETPVTPLEHVVIEL